MAFNNTKHYYPSQGRQKFLETFSDQTIADLSCRNPVSYAVACARAKDFRAVVVISGGQISGCAGGNDPIAYMGIHGISDGTLNIAGGRSMRDKFVKNNGCAQTNAAEPSKGSGVHVKTEYKGCTTGYPVTWIAHDGGHWPGAVDHGPESGAKSWVPGEIWSFFTQAQLSSKS